MTSLAMRKIVLAGLLAVTAVAVATLIAQADEQEEWHAPHRDTQKKNPVPSDDKSIAAGQASYAQQCVVCHGATGKGDGPAAAALTHKPGDLSDPKMSQQTDGELFWKITSGKTPMPAYEKLLTDDQRWQVVNYIRTLEKKK